MAVPASEAGPYRPDTPPSPVRGTETAIVSTSASITLKDLASLSPDLARILASGLEASRRKSCKDPVPFMRLPAELRIMIYRRSWTVISCPHKLTVRAGYDRYGYATGAEYWIGPAPGIQVQFPKIMMAMDPRIKREFAHELCANFPLHIHLGSFFTERIPSLSIHKPSIFLDHLKECQIQYSPRKLDWSGMRARGFKDMLSISNDCAEIVKMLLPFPCLQKVLIYTFLDPATHGRSPLQKSLNMLLEVMTKPLGPKKGHTAFAIMDPSWSLFVGWDITADGPCHGRFPDDNAVQYARSTCTALRKHNHDTRNCDSVLCNCKFWITKATTFIWRSYNVCERALSQLRQRTTQYHGVGAQAILGFYLFYSLSVKLPKLDISPAMWRNTPYSTLLSLELRSAEFGLLCAICTAAWTHRIIFYSRLRAMIHSYAIHMEAKVARLINLADSLGAPAFAKERLQDQLNFSQAVVASCGTQPHLGPFNPHIERLKRLGSGIDRLASFIMNLSFGLLFKTYNHLNNWILLSITLISPIIVGVTLGVSLAQGEWNWLGYIIAPYVGSLATWPGKAHELMHRACPDGGSTSLSCSTIPILALIVAILGMVCWVQVLDLLYGAAVTQMLRDEVQEIDAAFTSLKRDIDDFKQLVLRFFG